MDRPLDADELAAFARDGYVLRPGFFAEDAMAPVRAEMAAGCRDAPWRAPGHGALISHPPLMAIAAQLCGPGFRYHHLNTYHQGEGAPGVPWHVDFEQLALPMRRDPACVNLIVLIYPDGLCGEVGDLVVVPGTHRRLAGWTTFDLLGTMALPGEVVIDRVPPGTAVFCHTGLLHCRRPRPGVGPRFFCDVSYVSAGALWPASTQHDWRAMHAECRELGLDHDGRYAHLFEVDEFFDPHDAARVLDGLDQSEIYRRLLAGHAVAATEPL